MVMIYTKKDVQQATNNIYADDGTVFDISI